MNKIGQYKINYGGEWVKLPLFFKGDSLQIKIEGGHLWSSYDGVTWEDVGELNTNVDLALDPNSNNPIANSAVAKAIKGGIRFACVVNSENVPELEIINGKIYGTWIAPYADAEEETREFHTGDIIILINTDDLEIYLDEHSTKEFILTDITNEGSQYGWVELGDITPAQGMINESLKSYYKKSEVYNKSEIDTKIENIDITNTSSPIVRGDANNSAVLKGEYTVSGTKYKNKAISQVSMSAGAASTAGLKGWYYTKVNLSENLIWLSDTRSTGILQIKISTTTSTTPDSTSFVSGWKVGDEVTIVNDKKYDRCAKIESINGNMIKLDKLPFDSSTIVKSAPSIGDYNEPDEFSITAIKVSDSDTLKTRTVSSYDKGNVDFGGGAHAEGVQTYALNIGAHAEGIQTVAYGQYSHTEGFKSEAAYAAHAEGKNTSAIGHISHAEGEGTTALGNRSHTEGEGTTANGLNAHAEGKNTTADSNNSHAEGHQTIANGAASHAEGNYSKTGAIGAHAEGYYTVASGEYSHTSGDHTVAANKAEFACGKYNKSNEFTLFSIGNGTTDSNRSNAFEVTSNKSTEYVYTFPEKITWWFDENVTAELSGIENGIVKYEVVTTTWESDSGGDVYDKWGVLGATFYASYNPYSNSIAIDRYSPDYLSPDSETSRYLYRDTNLTNIVELYDGSTFWGFAVAAQKYEIGTHAYVDNERVLVESDLDEIDLSDYYTKSETNDKISSSALFEKYGNQNGVIMRRSSNKNTASGEYAFAINKNCKANANNSFAGGNMSDANGAASISFGNHTTTNNVGEAAFGQYNQSNSNTIFSVGNGSINGSVTVRKNAFEITADGLIYIYKNGERVCLQDLL